METQGLNEKLTALFKEQRRNRGNRRTKFIGNELDSLGDKMTTRCKTFENEEYIITEEEINWLG